MAKNEPVLVYNVKKGGEPYRIHPDLAKDKTWMESRGLLIHEQVKPMEVTNMPEVLTNDGKATVVTTMHVADATEVAEAVATSTKKGGKANAS